MELKEWRGVICTQYIWILDIWELECHFRSNLQGYFYFLTVSKLISLCGIKKREFISELLMYYHTSCYCKLGNIILRDGYRYRGSEHDTSEISSEWGILIRKANAPTKLKWWQVEEWHLLNSVRGALSPGWRELDTLLLRMTGGCQAFGPPPGRGQVTGCRNTPPIPPQGGWGEEKR